MKNLLILLLLIPVLSFAQENECDYCLSGTVLDAENRDTLIGAAVFFRGMLVPRTVGFGGKFYLSNLGIPKDEFLIIAAEGYKLKKMVYKGEKELTILLKRNYKKRKYWRDERKKKYGLFHFLMFKTE